MRTIFMPLMILLGLIGCAVLDKVPCKMTDSNTRCDRQQHEQGTAR